MSNGTFTITAVKKIIVEKWETFEDDYNTMTMEKSCGIIACALLLFSFTEWRKIFRLSSRASWSSKLSSWSFIFESKSRCRGGFYYFSDDFRWKNFRELSAWLSWNWYWCTNYTWDLTNPGFRWQFYFSFSVKNFFSNKNFTTSLKKIFLMAKYLYWESFNFLLIELWEYSSYRRIITVDYTGFYPC